MAIADRQTLRVITFMFAVALGATSNVGAQQITTRVRDGGGPGIGEMQAMDANGPQARIAVSRFTNKSNDAYNWYSSEIGDGMADMLTTALVNSGRFIVLERQALSDVIGEQDLGASGRVRSDTAAAIGEIEGAELMVVAAVTEFSDNASGSGGGLGAVGGGLFGAIAGKQSNAHMAIDLRLIDARTSRVLMATSVEGSAKDYKVGGLLGGVGGAFGIVGGMSKWKNTPREKALRVVIERAAEEVVRRTPAQYYHAGAAPTTSATRAAPGPTAPVEAPAARGGAARLVLTGVSVSAHNGPNAASPVAFKLSAGAMVDRLVAINGWVQVRDDQGRTGWVVAKETAPLQ